jgi:hypothetical protein
MGYLALTDLATEYVRAADFTDLVSMHNGGGLWDDFKNYAKYIYKSPLQGAILDHISYKGV